MGNSQITKQEQSLLKWGGLAGILGGILFILLWVIIIVGPVGMDDPADLTGWVTRFPEIKTARVIENSVYLLSIILEVALFLAIYRALHRTNLALAVFGSVLGILGLTVYMVGALPHVAHAPLSEMYHAPGASPADQAAIVLMWQATWGIFDAILFVGFFVIPVGILALGVAMLRSPDFGKVLGWVSVVLGLVGIVAAVLQMIDSSSMIGAGSYFACIIFYFIMGWKVYSLSR